MERIQKREKKLEHAESIPYAQLDTVTTLTDIRFNFIRFAGRRFVCTQSIGKQNKKIRGTKSMGGME